jgi:hypothetical protein
MVRARHPPDLLNGYHTAARGQSCRRYASAPPRVAPGLPRGQATPDRRNTTQPRCPKIVSGHAKSLIVWTLYGHKHMQRTENDHRRRALEVAKAAGNQRYPLTTTDNHYHGLRISGFGVRSSWGRSVRVVNVLVGSDPRYWDKEPGCSHYCRALQRDDDPAWVLSSTGWVRSIPGSSFLWWGGSFLDLNGG